MHSLTGERCIGRIVYRLSPDEKDPLLTQKGRQELWRKIQEMAREIDRLDAENARLKKELKEERKEHDEYRKRHPETVGVKNGKPYFLQSARQQPGGTGRKPGAQPGHRPLFRPTPSHIDEVVEADVDTCPVCRNNYRLVRHIPILGDSFLFE